jgi:hypothetical protein
MIKLRDKKSFSSLSVPTSSDYITAKNASFQLSENSSENTSNDYDEEDEEESSKSGVFEFKTSREQKKLTLKQDQKM